MTKQLIRFDWAIKRLLRNKANFVVLEGFLSELLFENIKIKEILESESNQEAEFDKYNRVDILTENEKNELIIVEIQNTYEIDYFQRMLYGTSKTIAERLDLGKDYQEIKKVISINIIYFDLGQGKDYIYKGTTNFVGFHQKDILGLSNKQKKVFNKEKVFEIFPEYYLIKVNKFDDIAKDTLDEWVYFLKNTQVKDTFSAKGLTQAKDILDIMILEKDDQYSYNRYLDYLHFKASEAFSMKMEAEEREEKMKEREINIKLEIAKNAIKKGLHDDLISELTGLSLSQIQKIRQEKE